MDTRAQAEFRFDDVSSRLVPYRGPGWKFRPFVKWIVILYLVVMLGISTLILKEQTLGAFLMESILPAAALFWVIRTRSRRELTTEPVELRFCDGLFTVVHPCSIIKAGRHEGCRRERILLRYDEVTQISYDLKLELVCVHGHVRSEFYDYPGEERPGVPPVKVKDVKDGAAWWYTTHLTKEQDEEILARLARCTGKEIDRFGAR